MFDFVIPLIELITALTALRGGNIIDAHNMLPKWYHTKFFIDKVIGESNLFYSFEKNQTEAALATIYSPIKQRKLSHHRDIGMMKIIPRRAEV